MYISQINLYFTYVSCVVKDVQCYEPFGGIALKNHAFSVSLINKCLTNLNTFSFFHGIKQIITMVICKCNFSEST